MFYGNLVNTAVAVDGLFVLSQKKMTNNNLSFDGTSTIRFRTPGLYKIHFDASGVGSAAGDIKVSPVIDGVQSTTIFAQETTSDATTIHNISFDFIMDIRYAFNGIASLAFNVTGVGMTPSSGNVIIERIA